MRLHIRILVALSVVLALYMVLVFAALRGFVYPTFSELENSAISFNVERIQSALDSEFTRLLLISGEYAQWDDSYRFAQDLNEDFRAANLVPGYMEGLDLDVMIYYDSSGRAIGSVVGGGFGFADVDPGTTSAQLIEGPSNRPHLLVSRSAKDGPINGMLNTNSGSLMVVSAPILRSDVSGPASGTLLVGRFLDQQKLADIRKNTGVDFRLRPPGYLQSLSDGQEPGQKAKTIEGIDSIIESPTVTVSYLALQDISNQPLGHLEIETPRDVMKAGLNTIYATAISLLAAGVLMLLAIWISIRKLITSPIVNLGQHIDAIRRDDDLDRKLDLNRSDEIGTLAESFDAMTGALRKSRDELTQARDAAVQLAQHKSDFLATMSHEIRTPLNGVLGMTELLLSTNLDGRQKRFAQTAHQSGDLLLSVINDILDYSKIDSDKLILDDSEIDVREIIEDLGSIFAQNTQRKNLELVCTTVPPNMHSRYRGDPVRIRQILSNLLSNAIKFTEAGEITLTASLVDETSPNSGVRFVVRDTGIGIEPNALEAIFESFSQADRSTTRRFGGTGLGLAIARQLTRLIGGNINVTSTPGQGSTFTVDLNLERLDQVGPSGRTGALQSISGARILIVDDNETNREVLRHQIRSWSMECHSATNASEALSMIDKANRTGCQFDLAILDLHMPDMDGSELAQLICKQPENDKLEVLMLSSVDISYRQHESLRSIISSFLTKPVRQSVLFDAIAKALVGDNVTVVPKTISLPDSMLHSKVLLAEDNAVNREVACEMLKQLNCSIDIATNGAEAAELVNTETYDVVLMDCNMPVADGFEATRRIRLDKRNQQLPIIALTANALEGDRERCLAAGMDDYISKPFTIEQLKDVLQRWSSTTALPAEVEADVRASGSSASVIQAETVATIRSMQREGQPDLFAKLVNLYLDSSAEDIGQLQQALSAQDTHQMIGAAHSLKSSSANVGARDLAAICESLEEELRNGKLDGANEELANISSEHERVVTALRREAGQS